MEQNGDRHIGEYYSPTIADDEWTIAAMNEEAEGETLPDASELAGIAKELKAGENDATH